MEFGGGVAVQIIWLLPVPSYGDPFASGIQFFLFALIARVAGEARERE